MRIKYLILFFLFNWLMIPFSFAEDFSIPHELNSGDILSADILNEILDNIRESNRSISESDLVGVWDCRSSNRYTTGISIASGWVLSSQGMIYFLDSTLTFSNDSDVFTIVSSAPNPFAISASNAVNSVYEINANWIYFQLQPEDAAMGFEINRISDSRIVFNSPSIDHASVICDLQSLPPDGPTLLSVELSGNTANLTWTDNADDETGYVIYRRDELTGAYNEITTIAANSTSYSETLSSDGTYWYRVQAENDDGHSVGSNVVKVVIGDGDD